MKKDDSTLDPDSLHNVKGHAKDLLLKANAFGHLPTPIDRIVESAKLFVNNEISLDANTNIFARFSDKVGKTARPQLHGLKKILGILYVPSGEIYLDHTQHEKRKAFIKLHETGHGFLPHQKRMFEYMEDGHQELDPEIEDLFEREANNFAVELLFQLDKFEKIAADYQISIQTPIELSEKFGSSIYAGIRRYVNTHFAPLALAVYDKPAEDRKYYLRRMPMYSDSFVKMFGQLSFPNPCDNSNCFGSLLGAKLRTDCYCGLKDLNGHTHETNIHIFSNSYENFVILIPAKKTSNRPYEFCLN